MPEVAAAIRNLTGDIMQVPNAVSAIKIDGKRAYARARSGEEVELKARPVTVSEFVVHDARAGLVDDLPVLDLDVSVTVSSGTYVRALARDLGAALGSAGHLTMLRRTRSGGYDLADAKTLEQLEAAADAANANGAGLPTITMADAAGRYLPTRNIAEPEAVDLAHGRWIAPNAAGGPHAALDPDGTLVAIIENVADVGKAKPVVVFAT